MKTIKTVPAVIKRRKIEAADRHKETDAVDAIFRHGLARLAARLKSGDASLGAKDLLMIHELRESLNVDDMSDASFYFTECIACVFQRSCSLYKEGSKCKLDLSDVLGNPKGMLEVMERLVQIHGDRVQRALLIEKLEGVIDKEVTSEILQYAELVGKYKEMHTETETLKITRTKSGRISNMFGDLIKQAQEQEQARVTIDAEYKVEDSGDS